MLEKFMMTIDIHIGPTFDTNLTYILKMAIDDKFLSPKPNFSNMMTVQN